MKRFLIFAITLAGLTAFSFVHAQESISSFDVSLEIQKDASLMVTETIAYDFGDAQRHGIYRDIPYRYTSTFGNYNLRISRITVSDEHGNAYRTSVSNQAGKKHIKIGDPDQLISGAHTYVIRYMVDRAFLYHDTFDALSWNVTGNDWKVPIGAVTGRVISPTLTNIDGMSAQCYAGVYGSTQQCTGSVEPALYKIANALTFSNFALQAGEGVTVDVRLPKNMVTQPSILKIILDFLADNWIVGIPILVFILMFWLWYTRGRDPKGRGTVVAQYDPPKRLTPSEVGTIIDESAGNKDISADIINLAIKGYLKIEQIDEKKFLKTDTDYRFIQLKLSDAALAPFEKKLLDGFFSTGATVDPTMGLGSVKLSKLKDKFYTTLATVKSEVYTSVVGKGYFAGSPAKIRAGYTVLSVIVFIVGIYLSKAMGAIAVISASVTSCIVFFFGWYMPKRTYQGALMREYILGLKEYLQVAEADRIKFHNAPEKKPERFEKLLPYAMVLGVEKQWAGQFKDIYTQPPEWYHSNYHGSFNSLLLVNNLSALNTRANSVMSSHPSSSGGSGGGGFSGGGFGGGGGGSW